MSVLDEELVEQWLNQNGFFTMRGVKCGVDEIDLLAIKHTQESVICWHVEVQVSFRPVGYICGNRNARRRTLEELSKSVDQWVSKKFTCEKKTDRRNLILSQFPWNFVFVCANVKDERELALMEDYGVKVIRYDKVLGELTDSKTHQTSSVANNIIEILKYQQKRS